MKRIFITVGTTQFDDLIEFVDLHSIGHHGYKFVAQISEEAIYKPKNIEYFGYSEFVEKHINDADIIISHAGAGSVYSLLERGKKLIVVPNLKRKDKHQMELAKYIAENNFAIVCNSVRGIFDSILEVENSAAISYEKVEFFGEDLILGLLK